MQYTAVYGIEEESKKGGESLARQESEVRALKKKQKTQRQRMILATIDAIAAVAGLLGSLIQILMQLIDKD